MSCGGCARVRGWLPESIRARLAEVERRMYAAKNPDIVVSYTTTAVTPAPETGAPSPQQTGRNLPGGDGGQEGSVT
jgi:hypothetical protein